MRAALLAPAAAVQFLTILPVRLPAALPAGVFPASVALFPAVGALIGLLVGGLDAAARAVVPVSVASVIDVIAFALITGGLHLDAIADSADGLLGHVARERRLAVMDESPIGAFGVVALALVLLLEVAAIASVAGPLRLPAFVAATTASRWSMAVLLVILPPARNGVVGSRFRAGLHLWHLLLATGLALVIVFVCFAAFGVVLPLVGGSVALLVGRLAVARIGGGTGDVYGAGGELAFASSLVIVTAVR